MSPAAPATLYATTETGPFRSTDAGESWKAAGSGFEAQSILTLALDPTRASVLYAATRAGGVFRSTDSGRSWAARKAGLALESVAALAVDPTNPSTLYAGGNYSGTVFKSTDSGETWGPAGAKLAGSYQVVTALAIDPGSPATIYAGATYGVFRSTDAGLTWNGGGPASVLALAIDPASPATLLAGTIRGVFKSFDAGRTWFETGPVDPGVRTVLVTRNALFAVAGFTCGFEPRIVRSTNAGVTWTPVDVGGNGRRHHALAADPVSGATLYAGADAGVFRSSDSGGTWSASSKGLTNVHVGALAIDPTRPRVVFAGTSNGVFRSTDGGMAWTSSNAGLPNLHVNTLAMTAAEPDTLYAGTQGDGVFKSTDAGETWVTASSGLGTNGRDRAIFALALDPTRPGTLYASAIDSTSGCFSRPLLLGFADVFRSTDGARSWAPANRYLGRDLEAVTTFAVDPRVPGTIHAGGYEGIYLSTDHGDSWASDRRGLLGKNLFVTALALDPTSTRMYAALTGGVFRRDGPLDAWKVASAGLTDLDVYDLALVPETPGTLYASTAHGGVFRSTDGGDAWVSAGEGLTAAYVGTLALGDRTLYAGTGAGVWRLDAPASATSVVPIVLDLETGHARYTSELVLTNAGATTRDVTLTYTPSLGTRSGAGTISIPLAAGQQQTYPDILSTLRTLGLAIPETSASAPQGGTLAVSYDPRDGAVHALARTTSPTADPQPPGRSGVAYAALASSRGATRGVVHALRATDSDRSNLAIYNPGADPVTVRVTLVSGTGDRKRAVASEGLTLPALGWAQLDDLLPRAGMTNAWAVLERTSAAGVFGGYGVVNDATTNDGSFVPMMAGAPVGTGLTLPVLVETGGFQTELVLTNTGVDPVDLEMRYAESTSPGLGPGGAVSVTLAPDEQRIIPEAIDFLRRNGAAIGGRGTGTFAGAVRIRVVGPAPTGLYAGARIVSPSDAGGQFGVFTPALLPGDAAADQASIHGLRADAFTRSNVAVVHAGVDTSGPVTLRLDVHDGSEGGAVKRTTTVTLGPGQWAQPGGFFGGSGVANGSVTVTRIAGTAPWIAYGVVNDGASPGQRTGDGAYVPMVR